MVQSIVSVAKVVFWKSNVYFLAKTKLSLRPLLIIHLEEDDIGRLSFKEDHMYYYQVQRQMKICHIQYCDFVAWMKYFHQTGF